MVGLLFSRRGPRPVGGLRADGFWSGGSGGLVAAGLGVLRREVGAHQHSIDSHSFSVFGFAGFGDEVGDDEFVDASVCISD